MTKEIDKPTTSEGKETKQKLSIEKVKKLLSKKNTSPKLEIVQGPIGCMLGIALFDQSPQAQMIAGLGFTIGTEINGQKVAITYGIQLYKDHSTIDNSDIIVPGKIIQTPDDQESPIGREKFIFLPEDTEVKIRYNQDTGTGEIEILSYPLDLHENIAKTANSSLNNFKGKSNVISTLIGELNDKFIEIQKIEKETSKEGTDNIIGKTKEDLIKSIKFLETIQDEIYKENAHKAIQDSPEYKQVQEYEKQIESKNEERKLAKLEFDTMKEINIEKLKKYIQQQNTHITKIQKILEDETQPKEEKIRKLQSALSKACSIGLFAIADNFIAQDSFQSLYRNISHENRPEYAKGELNIQEIHKTIKLLTDVQEKYPDILRQVGIVDQIKNSINAWKSKVEENVKNGIYNPFTRSDAIRYEHLRNMLGQICGNDGSVVNDMISIFDSLLEQRHQDGTNSGSFRNAVQEGISTYIQANKNSPAQDNDGDVSKPVINIKTIKYIDKELATELGLFDIDSQFWLETFISATQDPDIEKQYLELLSKQSKNITSSLFPNSDIKEYIDFLINFFQTKKYLGNQSGSTNRIDIIKEIQDIYTGVLSHKEAERQRKENIAIKSKERAKEVFKQLTSQQRKEYFTKAYNESRGQNHNTGIHTYQEFDDASIVTVISEHSYRSSRGGIERDSQLCLYVNDCTKKSSTGYQNYRDRFDSKNDNYNNQYVEVLEVKKTDDKYVIQVKTGTGSTKTLTMSPNNDYTINIHLLSELSGVSIEDKNLFLDGLKFQKELGTKN